MPPTSKNLRSSRLILTCLVLCACMALVAMPLVSGAGAADERASATVRIECTSVVLDAAVFGSVSGHAGIKSAPTTWSSRSNVRWNARWDSEGRYLV